MKKYFGIIAGILLVGCLSIFWPRPAVAESKQPYYEKEISYLFDIVKNSEPLKEELIRINPQLAHNVLAGDSKDCLVCQAMALLALRNNDDCWADTLGECEYSDDLDNCILMIVLDAEEDKD